MARSFRGFASIVISLLALALAATALFVALRGQPDSTVSTSGTGPTTAPTTDEPTSSAAAPPTPSDTGGIDPKAVYEPLYQDKELSIPGGSTADVDGPRVVVGADETSDFSYASGINQIRSTDLKAKLQSPNANPQDCAEALGSAPWTDDIAAAEGAVFCLVTRGGAATAQGIPQRMARVVVKSVNRDDILTVSVTAWSVPS